MNSRFAGLCLLVLASCGMKPIADAGIETIDSGSTCQLCTSWGNPHQAGVIAEPALTELSGLVASRAHPGVLYAHNDSGDRARFFALSITGAALGEFTLDGGAADDWEDIAIGPCPEGTCVYLGDIGDNLLRRTNYAVYRVKEPAVTVDSPAGVIDVAWQRFPYQFPNGEKHNAESLVMHPVSGRLYLFTKPTSGIPSRVYRFPELTTPEMVLTLEYVTDLKVPAPLDSQLTGADISPCGESVLLRMYNRLVQVTATEGQTFEQMLGNDVKPVAVADEPQGEAVAFSADGRSFFTSSEKLTTTLPLNVSSCR